MKIVLRSSGGDWQPEKEHQLDTSGLSAERARRVKSLVKTCRQGVKKAARKHPGAAGLMHYRVSVLSDAHGSDVEEFEFDEGSVEPEVLDVLDELMQEMKTGAAPASQPDTAKRFDVIFFDLGDTLVTGDRKWVPGARKALRELHGRGYRLGIISDTGNLKRKAVFELLPSDFDVSLFEPELIRLSFETGFEKPASKAFTTAVEAAGVPPGRCVFCTEAKAHVLAARKVGIHSILLAPGATTIGQLPDKLSALDESGAGSDLDNPMN